MMNDDSPTAAGTVISMITRNPYAPPQPTPRQRVRRFVDDHPVHAKVGRFVPEDGSPIWLALAAVTLLTSALIGTFYLMVMTVLLGDPNGLGALLSWSPFILGASMLIGVAGGTFVASSDKVMSIRDRSFRETMTRIGSAGFMVALAIPIVLMLFKTFVVMTVPA
jgi:hypothetical protein